MHIVGILGGVAAGKSLVAQQLAALGAGVLDADRAGHEVLRLPEVEAAARDRWGADIFGSDGHVDRQRLAHIVFADPPAGPPQRAYLEQLTHPVIGHMLAKQAEALAAAGKTVAVLDAPLLLEAGWDKLCEKLVFVDAPWEMRLARALARGWSKEQFILRQGAQDCVARKRSRADALIDNSGSPEHTQAQVEQFWQSLVG